VCSGAAQTLYKLSSPAINYCSRGHRSRSNMATFLDLYRVVQKKTVQSLKKPYKV